jgi:hypothetical protein
MPRVLTTNAIIMCPHGGVGTTIPTGPAFARGGAMCLDGDVGTLSCVMIPPCLGYNLQSLKLNSTYVMGRHVMLETDYIQSFTGFPLTVVETHTVYDETPPPGMTFPDSGPPPELKQDDKPVGTVAPPAMAFSLTTQMPAVMPFVFTAMSRHPRSWSIWHVGPPMIKRDLTNGSPLGITTMPAGGRWVSPQLVITMTVTAAYASTLMPGPHIFVLSAANHRGLSAMAQAILTVGP